jgi:hypothetical protein
MNIMRCVAGSDRSALRRRYQLLSSHISLSMHSRDSLAMTAEVKTTPSRYLGTVRARLAHSIRMLMSATVHYNANNISR